MKEIHRSEIDFRNCLNGNQFLIESFAEQREENYIKQSKIELDMDFTSDTAFQYIGDAEKAERLNKYKKAQQENFKKLEEHIEAIKKLEKTIIDNCKILETGSSIDWI